MLQQNIWHIAKYEDNKNHPKFAQTAKYCKSSFSFCSYEYTNSNLWPYLQIPWRNAWTLKLLAAFRGSTHFSLDKYRWTNWIFEVFAVALLQ